MKLDTASKGELDNGPVSKSRRGRASRSLRLLDTSSRRHDCPPFVSWSCLGSRSRTRFIICSSLIRPAHSRIWCNKVRKEREREKSEGRQHSGKSRTHAQYEVAQAPCLYLIISAITTTTTTPTNHRHANIRRVLRVYEDKASYRLDNK